MSAHQDVSEQFEQITSSDCFFGVLCVHILTYGCVLCILPSFFPTYLSFPPHHLETDVCPFLSVCGSPRPDRWRCHLFRKMVSPHDIKGHILFCLDLSIQDIICQENSWWYYLNGFTSTADRLEAKSLPESQKKQSQLQAGLKRTKQ